MKENLGFIGTGRMGDALIKGILKAKLTSPTKIYASDIDENKLKYLHSTLGIKVSTDNKKTIKNSDIVIFAVKPQIIKNVVLDVAPLITSSNHLLISIAAGVSTNFLESELPNRARLVRVMPNIACTVEASASAICPGSNATTEDLEKVKEIFGAVGRVVTVPEYLMDSVTGLSGSGPAFIFMIIEALADGGVYMGLDRKTSVTLAAQTVLGAAKMVLENGAHPGELKDMVTSPAGTTIRGIQVLENYGVRSAMIDAVIKASERSKELGNKEVELQKTKKINNF